ncbi:MAG: Tn3 family transposase [Deltaproteobacteria bacterium]|nr:Tn3 family transposase [Deltaproteobacteria bacterium]
MGALGLVLSFVVLFNTRYLQAVVLELTRRGRLGSYEDIARLLPLVRAHVNTQGRYNFARPLLEGSYAPSIIPTRMRMAKGGSKGCTEKVALPPSLEGSTRHRQGNSKGVPLEP